MPISTSTASKSDVQVPATGSALAVSLRTSEDGNDRVQGPRFRGGRRRKGVRVGGGKIVNPAGRAAKAAARVTRDVMGTENAVPRVMGRTTPHGLSLFKIVRRGDSVRDLRLQWDAEERAGIPERRRTPSLLVRSPTGRAS